MGSDASARSAGCSELSCDRNNEQEERLATLCDYVSGWVEVAFCPLGKMTEGVCSSPSGGGCQR